MAKGIVGKKIGMTQIFDESGVVIPVTVIEAGPCTVTQVKTPARDGYCAVQLGYQDKKESRVTKPLLGHFKKAKTTPKRVLKEFRMTTDESAQYNVGQVLTAAIFSEGEYVDVIGTSIGKGFQGGVKRHNWSLGPKTHGSNHHREPGSIGASADPARVIKGHPLPGRMGNKRITVQNLKIVGVDVDNNILLIRGAVPGHSEAIVMVKRSLKKGVAAADILPEPPEPEVEEVIEDVIPETVETTAAEAAADGAVHNDVSESDNQPVDTDTAEQPDENREKNNGQ